MTKRIIVLCGIPTAGKSTWTKQFCEAFPGAKSISRDEIRERLCGKDYWKKQAKKADNRDTVDERYVTTIFDKTVNTFLQDEAATIIFDNTHCKEFYINQIIKKYEPMGCQICFKFFDIPMWKAYYRNIIRYLGTSKWIPIRTLKDMRKNYDKLDKKKYYEKYMVF